MKKTYIQPITEALVVAEVEMIAASGVKSDIGINYGGIDETGSLDPSVKEDMFSDSPFE